MAALIAKGGVLFNPDGTVFEGALDLADVGIAAATTSVAGVVLKSTTVTDQAALTAAASVGVPTKVEFDKVVADAVAARAKLNELMAAQRVAGQQ